MRAMVWYIGISGESNGVLQSFMVPYDATFFLDVIIAITSIYAYAMRGRRKWKKQGNFTGNCRWESLN
jgi:hypothetical protein